MRATTLLLAGAVALCLTAAPAEATHSRGKCTQRGTTLAQNDYGRVYEVERGLYTLRLYGCLWSRNEPVTLETVTDDGFGTAYSYDQLTLRGHRVAWVLTGQDMTCKNSCPAGYDSTRDSVRRFDLAKRRGTESESTLAAISRLRLNSNGALAWLASGAGADQVVHAWDRDGQRELDSGPIRRFRLRGPALSWLNGDTPRSATLR